jgi:hypothetical protein
MRLRLLTLTLCLTAPAAARAQVAHAAPACATLTAETADRCLRMNQLQVIGTHNSYHLAPEPDVLAALGPRAAAIDYTHRPLREQLETLGMRQLEIDVYADPKGGLYAEPRLADLAPGLERVARPGPEMRRPGLKVLHGPPFDFRSTCPTFRGCLTEVREWSRAHPRHVPLVILVELKDGGPAGSRDARRPVPIPFDASQMDGLDAEIRAVFDDTHLLTPDDVRGSASTLRDAVASRGWPTLADARGKVMFAMDNGGVYRDTYLAGHPSLEGRVLFVSVDATHPAAAFMKLNDAIGPAADRIAQAVRAGFMVRTRADEPGREARTGDTTRRDSALQSGAQLISTDYPEPSPYASGKGYVVKLPGGAVARCNPVSAPAGCRDEWVGER